MNRANLRDERGVTMILFAVMLPLFMILTAIAWDAGNWWIHRKHLQTKVDAAALAAGGVWSFPCTANSDTAIVAEARKYVGQHIEADGTSYTATTFNPQVGDTPGTKIHVVLNGSTWYDDDQGLNPADKSGQPTPSGSICDASFLDVKGTERNNQPLFGWLPLAPDLKRKARIEIQEGEPDDLLPIAVRVPKPLSAAAVFYNESTGLIRAVRYFHEQCTATITACDSSMPPGLGQWTTFDPATGNWAQFTPGPNDGVVIATSFRPACDTTTPPIPAGVVVATGPGPCMEDAGFVNQSVNNFCRQASSGTYPVRCEYANGTGASQSVLSGLQFLRSFTGGNVTGGPPEMRSVWLSGASGCGAPTRQSYFNSETTPCSALLNADVDIGTIAGRTTANTDVKYGIVYGDAARTGQSCLDGQNRPNCDMSPSWTQTLNFSPANARYAIAIRVRLKNTIINPGPGQINCGGNFSATCQWFFTAAGRTTNWANNGATLDAVFNNPLQRSFMGNIDRSGVVKWLRLQADTDCSGVANFGIPETGPAASVQSGSCNQFVVDMGVQGGLAKDQDEPPIQINIGATSQSAILDCDPNIPNLKDEIQQGCGNPPVTYARNQFDTSPLCPPDSPGQFFDTPKTSPFNPPNNYPPWRCVLTQTSNAANQIEQGLNARLFGDPSNPTCPPDPGNATGTEFAAGRNYWHNANNQNDNLTFADNRVPYGVTDTNLADNLPDRLGLGGHDPRLVTLFFTTYDSFTGNGNEIYPIVGFGNFYITGYGRVNGNGGWQGGQPDDPCTDGSDPGPLYDPSPGAGRKTPPDLDMSGNGVVAWGHFVKVVTPRGRATGVLCKPNDFQPCVATLVQ